MDFIQFNDVNEAERIRALEMQRDALLAMVAAEKKRKKMLTEKMAQLMSKMDINDMAA